MCIRDSCLKQLDELERHADDEDQSSDLASEVRRNPFLAARASARGIAAPFKANNLPHLIRLSIGDDKISYEQKFKQTDPSSDDWVTRVGS